MRSSRLVLTSFVSAALLAAVSFRLAPDASAAGAPPPTSSTVHIPLQETTLSNGLRVIFSIDHSAPTYSICITYDVGSRNERPGRTGFAHLFEHMMFEGSENVGKGEHVILIYNNGGDMNGTTNKDRTNYFETLPANQLDLGLFLEADRMRALAINQANLDNQRNAVQEERRLGVDNQPYGKTFEVLDEMAYDNPAYQHSTIGSMADLNAASVQDVAAFFKTYYAPNNAVLVLVGDFEPAEALAKVKKYFGEIPRQPAPPQPDMAEPKQAAERRKTIDDGFAQLPRLDIVYKVPQAETPDWYALDVLGDILVKGRSSRLYEELVEEKEVAVNLSGGPEESRGPSLFHLTALVRPGKDVAGVEKAIEADVERVKTEGVKQEEVDKVVMEDRTDLIREDESTLGRAVLIGQFAVYYHNPGLINTRIDNYHKVTPADVKRVAEQYLTQNNRTVLITMPKAASAASSSGR